MLFRFAYYDVYLLAIKYLDMKDSIPCTVISDKAPALRNAFTKADWLLLDNTYSCYFHVKLNTGIVHHVYKGDTYLDKCVTLMHLSPSESSFKVMATLTAAFWKLDGAKSSAGLANKFMNSYVYSDWNKWYIGSSRYNGTGILAFVI